MCWVCLDSDDYARLERFKQCFETAETFYDFLQDDKIRSGGKEDRIRKTTHDIYTKVCGKGFFNPTNLPDGFDEEAKRNAAIFAIESAQIFHEEE